ncbi:MAG: DUF4394 domain-containing protein, partial [Gemmatimonadetes bacterium]|nr:DUF4394 domain-containing protein [Gemmatimonadota bacterium]
NRLIVFGSESPGSISRAYRIQGVPFLSRIVGLAYRPSTGVLYGVGNDSRVYTIDAGSGLATPVRADRFTPTIASFFDFHFGMAFDPESEQIYLIAAESRAMWIIDPDEGTAVGGEPAAFAAGDVHENVPPALTGLAYLSGIELEPSQDALRAQAGDCEDLLYAVDPDLAWIVGSCDPDKGDWISLVDIEQPFARCTSIGQLPDGNVFGVMLDEVSGFNQWVEINVRPTAELIFGDAVPDPSPIQSVATRGGAGASLDTNTIPSFDVRGSAPPAQSLPVGADGRGLLSLSASGSVPDALARCQRTSGSLTR